MLTSISGRYTVGQIRELTGLPEDSVARVILKLVGRGVVLWDDTLPFYDEPALLEVVPTFDPQNVNRNAHLDDTDRMLLTLINGRTTVRQMEAALPLSRDRLLASVIRLRLADVIGIADIATAAADARAQPGSGAATYQMPEGTTAPPKPETAAPPSTPVVPAAPAAPPRSAPAAAGAGAGEPAAGRAYKTRQDAFEEATRRLLKGEALTPEFGGDEETPVPAPRKTTSALRDREPPRYDHKSGRPSTKETRKPRTGEVKSRPPEASPGEPGAGLTVGKALLAVVLVAAAAMGAKLLTGGGKTATSTAAPETVDMLSQAIDLSTQHLLKEGWIAAQARPRWNDLSNGERTNVMREFEKWLDRDGLKGIQITDEDQRPIAEWEGGSLTIIN
ncbi:MAG: hypothetical protein IPK07_30100 [Deltaproteobacteria bacterium]|nr:hypothetical protein [Deltaproteobacteria bacterium]